MTHKRTVFTFITVLLLMLWGLTSIHAQSDDQPAPEFLYRDGNHLVLVNGYTGETSTLPIEVDERDLFEWSPDGGYLVAKLYDDAITKFCLNLYDVDKQTWIQPNPISCKAQDFAVTEDDSILYYADRGENFGSLWQYNIANMASREIYQTGEGYNYSDGISELRWSPTETYLTFSDYHLLSGGPLNTLVILDVESQQHTTVSAFNNYYANYALVWSTDDRWFLLNIKEEYVTSGTMPITNHQGDLYLINPETGEKYRLTYTPSLPKIDIHWTDDWKIAFTEVTEEKFTYTLDQAMTIEAVPPDQIIMPERIGVGEIRFTSDAMISPDLYVEARFRKNQKPNDTNNFELIILDTSINIPKTNFSATIVNPSRTDTVIIGWRPSDYPYAGG